MASELLKFRGGEGFWANSVSSRMAAMYGTSFAGWVRRFNDRKAGRAVGER